MFSRIDDFRPDAIISTTVGPVFTHLQDFTSRYSTELERKGVSYMSRLQYRFRTVSE